MDCKLPGTPPSFFPEIPSEGGILLHSCCAPCSSAILECMVTVDHAPVVFFSNSNIYPQAEYEKRRDELQQYCKRLGVEFVEDEYNHEDWREQVAKGREDAPERGSRCEQCFKYRLSRAAEYAEENHFSLLTTSLASSRWKSLEQVDKAGAEACSDKNDVQWWAMNWRKGGLQPRRNELIKLLEFYNQNYCGCEYSMRKEE